MYLYYLLGSTLFDHHDITTLTGITPTRAWNISDPHRHRAHHMRPTAYRRFSGWQVRAHTSESHDPRIHLEQLFALLSPAWSTLCDLGMVYNAQIPCAMFLYAGSPPPSIVLPPSILQQFVDLNACFDIDLYCWAQEDDRQPWPTDWLDEWIISLRLNTIETIYTLRGPDLDPAQVTARTGILPTVTWRAGATLPDHPDAIAADSGWLLATRQIASRDAEESMQELIDMLLPGWDALCELGQEYIATVTNIVRAHTGESTPWAGCMVPMAQRIIELNATLDIRLLCLHSDEFFLVNPPREA